MRVLPSGIGINYMIPLKTINFYRMKSQLLKTIRIIILLMFIQGLYLPSVCQEENLNVFDRWIEWSNGNNMLIHHLNDQAFDLLDKRDKEIAGFTTKADWINRQTAVKQTLTDIAGPFPEKTPLNAKITGTVKKDGYRIEKIIYESMPGFHVTGCLYIPDGLKGKNPAILNVIGHTDIAFRAELYQKMILHLVQKGFIVFAIDPVSQGERVQYFDSEKGASVIGGSTTEHSYFGNQCFLAGVSPGRYFIWDGIRGIDYLVSRKEVDPERIGVTGISGGGTQTAYISSLDERVKASAPTCYITGFRRLLESLGPQDAEQNLYHAVKRGITHADFIVSRAPKPTLMVTTTRDFFSIQGARETYAELKNVYRAFGKEEDMQMTEDDEGHTLSPKNNQTTVAFFQKYLDLPGNPVAGEIKILPVEDLQVTETGQLATSVEGETVFSINKKESQKLIDKINTSRSSGDKHLEIVRQKAKDLSGYVEPEEDVKSVFRGRYRREGYSIEMYALHGEGNYVIPLLLFIPEKGNNFPGVIYLHPENKAADAAPGGQIEELVKQGYLVAAPDLPGVGEVADQGSPNKPFHLSLLIGRSLTGVQAGDVGRIVNFLKSRPDVNRDKITAVAIDDMGPTLLHAAALNSSIKSVSVVGSLISYKSVVMNRFYDTSLPKYFVAGVLTAYDLPDLIACIAPRKVAVAGLKDQMKQPASESLIIEELKFPRSVYTNKNIADNFNISTKEYKISSLVKWSVN